MSQLKVLVCGSSIAGPATAYWLAKTGAKVTVIERFDTFRTGGHNVDIRSTGIPIMRKMTGMEEKVNECKMDLKGLSMVDKDGRPYGVLGAVEDGGQSQSLVSEYEVYRGDLSKVLYDLTLNNKNIDYRFGQQVVSIDYKDGKAVVGLSRGNDKEIYDLVVACDGATSRTRSIGLGIQPKEGIIPMNAWAAYLSIPKLPPYEIVNIGMGHSTLRGRAISIDDTDPKETRVVFTKIESGQDATQGMERFRMANKSGQDGLKDYIRELYADVGWKAPEVLAQLDETIEFYASEWCQVKLPRIHSTNFVCVGDAGYATGPTGGGTTMALTGAYVLAGEIQNAPDLNTALENYEKRMRPIITDFQKIPPFVPGAMAPQTSFGIWFRNTIFSFLAKTRALEFAGKYFSSSLDTGEKFNIPDYTFKL